MVKVTLSFRSQGFEKITLFHLGTSCKEDQSCQYIDLFTTRHKVVHNGRYPNFKGLLFDKKTTYMAQILQSLSYKVFSIILPKFNTFGLCIPILGTSAIMDQIACCCNVTTSETGLLIQNLWLKITPCDHYNHKETKICALKTWLQTVNSVFATRACERYGFSAQALHSIDARFLSDQYKGLISPGAKSQKGCIKHVFVYPSRWQISVGFI